MPIYRAKTELDFLKRVDDRYRSGDTQEVIASAEGVVVSALRWKVQSLGFCFTREGGLRLVDTMLGRDLRDWLAKGELDAAPAEGLVAA